MGWRYQIPFLLDQGLRVVAPDMMGYGGTVRNIRYETSTEQLSRFFNFVKTNQHRPS